MNGNGDYFVLEGDNYECDAERLEGSSARPPQQKEPDRYHDDILILLWWMNMGYPEGDYGN